MQTIAIVNEKGGTGKTTTAVNLSAALGQLGRKVLLVDLDGQAASSRWLGVEDDNRFADALWEGDGLEPVPDVIPGVSLAPASGKLDSVSHDLRPTQGGQLRKLLSGLNGFDYTIIDCPPSLGNRLIGNALLAATHAIVPVETSILALDGLKILLTTFEDVRQGFDHEIILSGVLACRYDARTRLSGLILDELNRALPGKVFKTVIRENVRVRECPGSGQSILTYAPKSHAAEDYMSLAREVVGLSDEGTLAGAEQGQVGVSGLTEEQGVAVGEMRQQVDAMLRKLDQRPKEPAHGEPQADSAAAELKEAFGLEESATVPEEAAADPVEAAPEPEEATAGPEEATPEPEEATAQPEEATAQPEESAAGPEEATAEPEEAAAEPEEAAAVPEEAAAEPEEATAEPETLATEGQGEGEAGPGPIADGVLASADEQDEAIPPWPRHSAGPGTEVSRDETPSAAGSDESTVQIDDGLPKRGVRVIDKSHSIIGRNGTGRALGAVHEAEKIHEPSEGRAEPPTAEPPAPEPLAAEPPAPEPLAAEPPAPEPLAAEPPEPEPPEPEPSTAEAPASPGAEGPEPAETPSGPPGKDYPALRAMLQSIAPGADEQPPTPDQTPPQSAEGAGWRRLFHKVAGVK